MSNDHIHRRTPLILMTMAALWLAAHPWRGIWHDSMLYTVQALRRIDPINYGHDLFFLFGSQDAYTLFSPLYASAISLAGLPNAALLLLVIGYGIWIGAAAFLLSSLLRGFYFWLGLAMLFAYPSDYGPLPGTLHLAESFLTPRLFAEGLGILALACVVRGKWKWGILPAILALALHPLIASAALLAAGLLLARGNWRATATLLGVGGLALALAVAAGIPPFDRLLLEMDAEWLALTARRTPMVTWRAWQAQEWVSRTALAFCLLASAGYLAAGNTGRIFRCAAMLGAGGLLATFVGTGLTSNVLLIQIQPWRLLWLTQFCSWVALAWLFSHYWQRGRAMQFLLVTLCMAVLTRNTVGGAIAMFACAALCHYAARPVPAWPAWGNKAAIAFFAALATAWLVEVTRITLIQAPLLPRQGLTWTVLLWHLNALEWGGGAMAATLLLALIWHWAPSDKTAKHLAAFALAFGGLFLAIVFASSNSRGPHDLSAQGEQSVQAAFMPLIPVDATVYWQNNVMVTWAVLHRSSYASMTQLTGLVFNRGTAIEGARRMERIWRLGGEDALIAPNSPQTRLFAMRMGQRPTLASLTFVCNDPQLDFVVLTVQLGSGIAAQAHDEESGKTYYLYDCARLRGR